jgi:hypothetical protein
VVLAALSLSLLGSGSGLEAGKTVWPALPALKAPAPAPWRVPDSQLLAEVAMAEDPSAGAAVMWTVVNRARAARTSLMTEVLRPGAYGTRKGGKWRPSWWPGRAWQAPADLRALVRLRRTARDVLVGRLADPTGGARHFHRVGTWTPPWAPEPAVWRVYGSHAFYRTK